MCCIFLTGLHRYLHVPSASQGIFSKTILEPILNIVVALFLYKIRSDSELYSISIGLLPSSYITEKSVRISQQIYKNNRNMSETVGRKNLKETEKEKISVNFSTPTCMKNFHDSAQYFHLCIANLDPRYRMIKGNKIRFHENWQNLRDTFPENFITKKNIENGFSPFNLVVMGMELTSPEKENNVSDIEKTKIDKSSNDGLLDDDNNGSKNNGNKNNGKKNNGNRNEIESIVSVASSNKNGNSNDITNQNGNKCPGNDVNSNSNSSEEGSMGVVMDLSRTQILKMTSVLNNQWLKLNS